MAKRWVVRALWSLPLWVVIGLYAYGKPLLTRLLDESQGQLQGWLTELVGAPVELGRVQVTWDWWFPEISAHGFRTSMLQIEAKRLSLRLDLRESLQARQLRFGRVSVDGFRANVREEDDRETLRRFSSGSVSSAAPAVALMGLARQFDLEWSDLKVRVERKRAAPWAFAAETWKTRMGRAQIESQISQFTVEVPLVWPQALKLQTLKLGVKRKDPHLLELRVDDAVLGPGLSLRASGDLDDRDLSWNGQLEFQSAELQKWLPWVPTPWLHPDVRVWIENHLDAAQLDGLRVAGIFGGAQTDFEITSRLKLARFEYAEEWPELKHMQGHFKISPRAIDVQLDTSEMAGIPLGKTLLTSKAPFSHLKAQTSMHLRQDTKGFDPVPTFFEQTPLKTAVAPFLEKFVWGPEKVFDLALDVSLDEDEPRVTGAVDIRQGELRLRAFPMSVVGLKGQLLWNDKQLKLNNMKGRIDGEELRASGVVPFRGSNSEGPRVHLDGRLSTAILAQLAGQPLPDVAGTVPFEADVMLKGTQTTVEFQSDGKGAHVKLPEPLRKDPETPWAIRGSVEFQNDRWSQATARVELPALRSGSSNIQIQAQRTDSENLAFKVKGNVGKIEPTVWKDWLGRKSMSNAANSLKWSGQFDLTTEEWAGAQYRWPQLRVQAASRETAWDLKFSAPDIEGAVEWPRDTSPDAIRADDPPWVRARFLRLTLPEFPKGNGEQPAEPVLHPQGPSLDLRVERLRVGPQLFGTVHLKLQRKAQVYQMLQGEIHGPEMDAVLERAQVTLPSPDSTNSGKTSVSAQLTIKQTLVPTRFERLRAVESGPSRWSLDLQWPGGPEGFALKHLDGSVVGTIQRGVFRGIESGAASAFNFLSYASDDTDQKILRFTKGAVDLRFRPGTVVFKKLRALVGSVYTRVSGQAQTEAETYELEARVTPLVEDFDEQGEEPGNLLSHTYTVTGPWARPSVKLKIF